MLPGLATYNTYMRSFQYKLLNNVLFLNKKLYILGIKLPALCSFCNLCDETPLHIFYECYSIKCSWLDLVHFFQNSLVLLILKLQTAISGFLDSTNSDYIFKKNELLINDILLIFKLYVYRSREKQFLHINNLIVEIKSAKAIEKLIATSNSKNTIAFKTKWHIANDIISITYRGWMQNMSLNIGTGKLHIKHLSEKWGGLGGKSLRTFYAVVVFSVVVFVLCFRFLTLILLIF